MDSSRFDCLTKSLATATGRRTAAKLVAAAPSERSAWATLGSSRPPPPASAAASIATTTTTVVVTAASVTSVATGAGAKMATRRQPRA